MPISFYMGVSVIPGVGSRSASRIECESVARREMYAVVETDPTCFILSNRGSQCYQK